ncbi:MAG: guanylate kinase [candidate division Zixibacteria bacterium]|nr:guanylate kinase [candidate division Zixibacteria bacterium]
MKKANLVVLSSPSGGGKTTICRKILKKHKDYLYSISATTRKKRENEKERKDYFFLSENEFNQIKKRRGFVEWAKVHGEYYGTLKKLVEQAEKEGRTALFVLDVQGGMAIKKKYPESILIFLLPPSLGELKRRLIGRGTDNIDEVEKRLETALKEIKFLSKYDYVVINKNLEETVKLVEKIIEAEKHKSSRFDFKKWDKDSKFP